MEFVIIGGVVVITHGFTRMTEDLDICYDLPFVLDAATFRTGLNFTLETNAGDLDLLGEVTGLGSFAEIERDAVRSEIYGRQVRVIRELKKRLPRG